MEAEPVVEKEPPEEEVRWEAEPMEVEGGEGDDLVRRWLWLRLEISNLNGALHAPRCLSGLRDHRPSLHLIKLRAIHHRSPLLRHDSGA